MTVRYFKIMADQSTSSRGRERILLMDDEEFMRDTVSAMIEHLGYEAVCTKNGEETLSLIKQERAAGRDFSAIILDLVIPGGVGGREVVARIRETDKLIPIIVASGYSKDPVMANPTQFGFSGGIAKPFGLKDFGELMKNVIEKDRSDAPPSSAS
jgi:two-component system, cell cycle sensor histidine kinase and response regulator CckA